MAAALIGVAKDAGSRTLIITAQSDKVKSQKIDTGVVLPAQTMANDETANPALLPMGSLFEAAELIFFDLVTRFQTKKGLEP
jgi:6-phospho-3-hexuloisomerase